MALSNTAFADVTHSRSTYPDRETERIIVSIRGEQDHSTEAALSKTLAQAIALSDADLVVDLSNVHFMDSSTVGVILRAREFLEVRSRSLVMHAPSAFARRVLELCRVSDLETGTLGRVRARP